MQYGKQITLSSAWAGDLYARALEILKSSNFNSFNQIPQNPQSGKPAKDSDWGISYIQQAYRKVVAGNYLLVRFNEPQKIKTVGADLTVLEIVIGLNGTDIAGPVFSIDEEGRVVSHAKYSGPKCFNLLDLIKELTKSP